MGQMTSTYSPLLKWSWLAWHLPNPGSSGLYLEAPRREQPLLLEPERKYGSWAQVRLQSFVSVSRGKSSSRAILRFFKPFHSVEQQKLGNVHEFCPEHHEAQRQRLLVIFGIIAFVFLLDACVETVDCVSSMLPQNTVLSNVLLLHREVGKSWMILV